MKISVILILVISISIIACSQSGEELLKPEDLGDGWKVSLAENEGMDKKKLKRIINSIPQKNPKLDAIIIAKNNKLIVDQYFNGYGPDSLHKVWSITKSITGTLIGIAKDQGLLSEKDSINKYLTNYMTDEKSSKNAICIEHLITMTSGLKWKELGGPGSTGFQLPYSQDWIKFTLSQPHIAVPGKKFNYSTGNSMLLAPIIRSATGLEADEFAAKYLFKELNIVNYEWDKQSDFWVKTQSGELPGAKVPPPIHYETPFANFTNTGSGLRMRPRDLCKIGQLYLNNGEWNNKQIVSKDWIEMSIKPHFKNDDYGYHWRLIKIAGKECYYSTGFGLQRIFVFPKFNMVVVLTQSHYETMPQGNKLTNELLIEILEAIK